MLDAPRFDCRVQKSGGNRNAAQTLEIMDYSDLLAVITNETFSVLHGVEGCDVCGDWSVAGVSRG